jgi:hypothetical protein
MYTFEQLKEDVRKEAEALRVHATKEERERLSIKKFSPRDIDCCIYGFIGDGCNSKRASELIDKCAIRHFEYLPDDRDDLVHMVTDKPNDFVYVRVNQRHEYTFSAIEAYICLPEACNASLISYLRGETETLEL